MSTVRKVKNYIRLYLLYYKIPLLTILILLVNISMYAQKEVGITKIEGYVVDDITDEPLPFVNIYFKNTTIGTTSDLDGNYKIKNHRGSDTLIFSMLGYHQTKVFVEKGKKYKLVVRLKKIPKLLMKLL